MKFSIAATLGVMVAEVQARVCRALAMSGGGSNGAWEAGVIYGFAHSANPEDFYYDVVSGISAGSINTAALAPWAPEDIVAATEFISETWNTLTNDQIWSYQPDIAPIQGEGVKWELGLNGFMNYQGAINDHPALQTITDILAAFPDGYKKNVIVSAADVNSGEYHAFTNFNTQYTDLPKAAMSSASIPAIFPPMEWNGSVYMDGGTVWNLNIDSAIQACLNMGFAENEIILDALSCYPRSVKTEPTVSNNALNNFLENRAVHKFYNGTRDILGELLAYPNVNYRYYVLNNDPALGLDEINFNADATWHLQLNGIAQAADAIAAGPGFGVQTLQNWDANVDGVQSKFASFGHYFEDQISRVL